MKIYGAVKIWLVMFCLLQGFYDHSYHLSDSWVPFAEMLVKLLRSFYGHSYHLSDSWVPFAEMLVKLNTFGT